MTKILKGHSGCSLEIIKKNDILMVRKTARDKSYNQRLRKQMIKQQRFLSKGSDDIFTPKVYDYGFDSQECFYFDMEFIEGQTVANYIEKTDLPAVNMLLTKLLHHVKPSLGQKQNCNQKIQKKIQELTELQTDSSKNVKVALSLLKEFDWSYVSNSPCHGDLTFENIIITNNGEFYLIDFLDSFCDSWIVDFAKIMQDLEIGWSYRLDKTNASRNVQLLFAKKRFLEKLTKLEHGNKMIKTIYHMLLLNILRIFPYTTDNHTKNFLNTAINKTLQIIGSFENE